MSNHIPAKVSDVFDPTRWRTVSGFDDFQDMTYHRQVERSADGTVTRDLPTVRIAFNRPEVRNAFRPGTVDELYRAMDHARMTPDVATVLLTGNGPSPKDGGHSFCSGGDQRIRGRDGYRYADGETQETIDPARAGRLHILEVQRLMRTMPKVVIAVVNGWAAGGGHSLHVVSDLTIASRQHGKFKQTDATVGSFDAGYGSALLARQIGQKAAREIFFLAREYSAEDMVRMGAVNEAVDHETPRGSGPGIRRGHRPPVTPGHPHAQVRLQPRRRRPGRPAGLRRRSHPPRLHDGRGRGGQGSLPGKTRPGLVPLPALLLRQDGT